jgi:enoyl-CoA hydratase/carnithine racemase
LIRVATEGPIGRLILDRPEKRNAISRAMWQAIPLAVAQLEADPAIRVIVLQGAGEHFAAGADISEFDHVYGSRENAAAYAADLAGAMEALTAGKKPRIAMIRGVCVGGGVALAVSCDMRFAESAARFAVTPAKLGIAYCFEDTRRLVACIGASAAKDMLFSGRLLDTGEALRVGLIDRVFAADWLEDDTLAYAHALAANSPATIAVARDFIARALAGQQAETEATHTAYLDILNGPDFHEGKSAFREKRPPRFQNNPKSPPPRGED